MDMEAPWAGAESDDTRAIPGTTEQSHQTECTTTGWAGLIQAWEARNGSSNTDDRVCHPSCFILSRTQRLPSKVIRLALSCFTAKGSTLPSRADVPFSLYFLCLATIGCISLHLIEPLFLYNSLVQTNSAAFFFFFFSLLSFLFRILHFHISLLLFNGNTYGRIEWSTSLIVAALNGRRDVL